jgi:hypothetical protein
LVIRLAIAAAYRKGYSGTHPAKQSETIPRKFSVQPALLKRRKCRASVDRYSTFSFFSSVPGEVFAPFMLERK